MILESQNENGLLRATGKELLRLAQIALNVSGPNTRVFIRRKQSRFDGIVLSNEDGPRYETGKVTYVTPESLGIHRQYNPPQHRKRARECQS